jgi:hypothetical protein
VEVLSVEVVEVAEVEEDMVQEEEKVFKGHRHLLGYSLK